MNKQQKIDQLEKRIEILENLVFSIMGAKKDTELYIEDPKIMRSIFNKTKGGRFKATDLVDLGISETTRGIGSWIGKRLNRDISGLMIIKSGRCTETNSYKYRVVECEGLF